MEQRESEENVQGLHTAPTYLPVAGPMYSILFPPITMDVYFHKANPSTLCTRIHPLLSTHMEGSSNSPRFSYITDFPFYLSTTGIYGNM